MEPYKTAIFLNKTWFRNGNFIRCDLGLCLPNTLLRTQCSVGVPCPGCLTAKRRGQAFPTPQPLLPVWVDGQHACYLPLGPVCSWSSVYLLLHLPPSIVTFLCHLVFYVSSLLGAPFIDSVFFSMTIYQSPRARNCYLSWGYMGKQANMGDSCFQKLPSNSVKTMAVFVFAPCSLQYHTLNRGSKVLFWRVNCIFLQSFIDCRWKANQS